MITSHSLLVMIMLNYYRFISCYCHYNPFASKVILDLTQYFPPPLYVLSQRDSLNPQPVLPSQNGSE